MTDLTKIKTPYGILLDEQPEVAKALRECGGPWQELSIYSGSWLDLHDEEPRWKELGRTYRQKPQPPKPLEFWIEINPTGSIVCTYHYNPYHPVYSSSRLIHVREVIK